MGKNIRNCRLCKQTMESSPFTMCRLCLVESNRVRNFIAKHPHVSVDEIAAATNIPLEKIHDMVELGIKKKEYTSKVH